MGFESWPFKDPEERLDYDIDWAADLGTDTIAASTWEIVAGSGIAVDDDEFTDTVSKVWLSGGVLGVTYQLKNHMTTAAGREFEKTMKLKIRAK